MKRVTCLLLCLALCCALFACADPRPIELTTGEDVTTTVLDEPTTHAAIIGESISWRELDAESYGVKNFIKTWFDNYYNPKPRGDVSLSDTIKISTDLGAEWEIWMRDEATGKDELLVGVDRENSLVPVFLGEINERYFLFMWAIMDSDGSFNPMIYDIQEKREIEIQYPEGAGHYIQTIDGRVYMVYAGTGLGTSGEVGLRLLCIDTSALAKGEPIAAKDVLKGVPAYDNFLENLSECDIPNALSSDARYFAVFNDDDNPVLHVFDTTRRELIFTLDQQQALGGNLRVAFIDTHTLYWFGEKNIIEITLP